MKRIYISLLALMALPMAAQDTGFSAGAGLILAPQQYFGSYNKAVNNDGGYILNGAYSLATSESNVSGRIGLTLGFMPGQATAYGLTTSLTLYQLSGDLVLRSTESKWAGVFGISLNHYTARFSGTEDTANPNDTNGHFPIAGTQGLKFGFRLGVEYAFTKSVSGELLLQQTELGGQNSHDSYLRAGGINPSWLQVGISYKF